MHPIYHTDAIVLGSAERSEADKVFLLFTREQGVLRVRATGIRKLASKLRYSLQDYSVASLGLIRGRHSWRLGSAGAKPLFDPKNKLLMRAFQNTCRLLSRMVPREAEETILFDDIANIYRVADTLELTPKTASDIALLAGVKILYTLGYIPHESIPEAFLETPYKVLPLAEARAHRAELTGAIHAALESSHLIY